VVGVGGRADVVIPGTILVRGKPPKYVFGQTVMNIVFPDPVSSISGLAEFRFNIDSYFRDLAARNRDVYLAEVPVQAAADAQAEAERLNQVRRSPPPCS